MYADRQPEWNSVFAVKVLHTSDWSVRADSDSFKTLLFPVFTWWLYHSDSVLGSGYRHFLHPAIPDEFVRPDAVMTQG